MAVVKEFGDRPFSSTFGWLFTKTGKFFVILFFVLFIAFIIVLIWAIRTEGNSPYPYVNYVYSIAVDPFINSGVFNYIKKGLLAVSSIVSPSAQAEILQDTTWKTYVEKNTNKNLGVKLKRFEVTPSVIPMDYAQNIKGIAEGTILSLEGTNVKFSCLADGKEIPEYFGESEFYFYPDVEESFTFECNYGKEDFDIDFDKATSSGKAQLQISYDFLTESSLIIYTLDKEVENEMNKNDVDIFKGLSSKYLKDGISYAVSTEGPVKLGLQSFYSQPLSDEMDYILTIRIEDNNKWMGGLEEIEEFDLLLSEGLVLKDEEDMFEEIGVEDSLILYRAKDAFIERLYTICPPEEDDFGLIGSDCWKAGNLEDSTKFSVKEDFDKLTEELIKAKVRYRFGEIKQDTITFTNTNN